MIFVREIVLEIGFPTFRSTLVTDPLALLLAELLPLTTTDTLDTLLALKL
jgi:hypothetical protein